MISRIQYLRLSVLIPFALVPPSVAIYFAATMMPIPRWLSFAAMVGWAAPPFFGIPYIVLVTLTLVALRNRTWRAHVVAVIFAPPIMTVVMFVISQIANVEDTSDWLSSVGPLCLATGYTYVAILFAVWFVLAKCGLITAEPSAGISTQISPRPLSNSA